MPDVDDFDPALFGTWPDSPAYGVADAVDTEAAGWAEGKSWRAAGHTAAILAIETKSAAPPEGELRLLLNDMTREMRGQFDYFRRLRQEAEARDDGGADEAAAKLARADVKAANDAMSLIVRTLEKIDALQRQLARDRELEAERHADTPDYREVRNKILIQIEARADEKARRLYAEWVAGTGPPPIGEGAGGLAAVDPDAGQPLRPPPGEGAG